MLYWPSLLVDLDGTNLRFPLTHVGKQSVRRKFFEPFLLLSVYKLELALFAVGLVYTRKFYDDWIFLLCHIPPCFGLRSLL